MNGSASVHELTPQWFNVDPFCRKRIMIKSDALKSLGRDNIQKSPLFSYRCIRNGDEANVMISEIKRIDFLLVSLACREKVCELTHQHLCNSRVM